MPIFTRSHNGMPNVGQGNGWTASEWRRAPRRTVCLSDLQATNRGHYLNAGRVRRYAGGGGGDPYVIESDGQYYVADGHHRVAAAIERGDRTIKARVMRAGR